MSKEKEKREKNIQDKRKEKLGRKEIYAIEKCVEETKMQKEKKKEKGNTSVTQVTSFMPKTVFEWKKHCHWKVEASRHWHLAGNLVESRRCRT
jgi:hypothetical protein